MCFDALVGGGGGFLVGCDGKDLRGIKGGGIDDPGADVEGPGAGGGVSSRVPANKSKSSKSRMAALGAEQEKSTVSRSSGGEVETGASFSCVAGFPGAFAGIATGRDSSSSAGGVCMALFGLAMLEGACSLFGPPIRSSYLLHLSCRYTARHLSMIDLVLSRLKGIFIGRSRSVSLPSPRAITKSFTVKQHMQRNLSNSLGTRTRLSQHMHLRIVFPSSSSDPPCFFFPLITLPGGGRWASSGWSSTGTSASSMSPSPSPTTPKFPVLLFRPNSFGKG